MSAYYLPVRKDRFVRNAYDIMKEQSEEKILKLNEVALNLSDGGRLKPEQRLFLSQEGVTETFDAVNTKDEKLMKVALHDKLHQPYREKLVPGMKEIMEAFKHEDGVLGCVLSGAGPTMLIISHKYDLDKIKSTVKEIWEPQSVKVDIRTLKVEQNGAEIIE